MNPTSIVEKGIKDMNERKRVLKTLANQEERMKRFEGKKGLGELTRLDRNDSR